MRRKRIYSLLLALALAAGLLTGCGQENTAQESTADEALPTLVVSVVFRRSACTMVSVMPVRTLARPSAKQHPSGHWNQCITRRPRVDRGVLM